MSFKLKLTQKLVNAIISNCPDEDGDSSSVPLICEIIDQGGVGVDFHSPELHQNCLDVIKKIFNSVVVNNFLQVKLFGCTNLNDYEEKVQLLLEKVLNNSEIEESLFFEANIPICDRFLSIVLPGVDSEDIKIDIKLPISSGFGICYNPNVYELYYNIKDIPEYLLKFKFNKNTTDASLSFVKKTDFES